MVGLSVVACLGGILSIVIINTCVRAVDAAFFPARAAFEPSVLELSEALARTTDTAGVTAVVEAAARAWLGCAHVRLELAGDTGESKASPRDLDCTWLSRPMTFCGERLGEIRVARMTGGALFNSEDRALLQTIS